MWIRNINSGKGKTYSLFCLCVNDSMCYFLVLDGWCDKERKRDKGKREKRTTNTTLFLARNFKVTSRN